MNVAWLGRGCLSTDVSVDYLAACCTAAEAAAALNAVPDNFIARRLRPLLVAVLLINCRRSPPTVYGLCLSIVMCRNQDCEIRFDIKYRYLIDF